MSEYDEEHFIRIKPVLKCVKCDNAKDIFKDGLCIECSKGERT